MKSQFLNIFCSRFLLIIFFFCAVGYSQTKTIVPQILEFNKICAGDYNQFDATFNYSNFPIGSTFEIQLSDGSGSFANPISTTTLSTADISANQKKITFAVPATLIGSENYKLRVKEITSNFTSVSFAVKDPNNNNGTLNYFAAYYKSYEDVYFINDKLSIASMCPGGSVTLSIYNPTPNIQNSSPANYANIKYKWYKGSSVVLGQTGSSLVVNSPGTYYAVIDYSSCTDSNSQSNIVTVVESSGGVSSTSLSSSLGNPFCSDGSTSTILSLDSVGGNSFQWSKDGVKIPGATNKTLGVTQAGLYSLLVDFGGCLSTFTIDLKSFNLQSSINIPQNNNLEDGQTKEVIVTTTAVNPTFEWYKENILISGNSTNTFNVTSIGNYKVKIIPQSGCAIIKDIAFSFKSIVDLNAVKIPNLISPNGDGINDTWVIPEEYCVGTNTLIEILDSNGKVVFTTQDYLNNWPENVINFKQVNPVYYYILKSPDGKEKKGSITIVK